MHTQADQLRPQLLMEQFDTLPSQYRSLDICMKKFDAEKLFFDKMAAFCIVTSFSLLTITVCRVRRVSNKHCLFPFSFLQNKVNTVSHMSFSVCHEKTCFTACANNNFADQLHYHFC